MECRVKHGQTHNDSVQSLWDGSHAKGFKLPYSEDGKDDLQRFKRYGEVVGWAEKHWSLHLSALLKGKVYSRLTPEQAKSYSELKQALLKRYKMTEDGF